MPITVQFQGEDGERIGPLWAELNSTKALSAPAEDTCCLKYIDPYGDTVFNHLQWDQLPHELREQSMPRRDEALSRTVDSLIHFIERNRNDLHVYLRFIGD